MIAQSRLREYSFIVELIAFWRGVSIRQLADLGFRFANSQLIHWMTKWYGFNILPIWRRKPENFLIMDE